MQYHIWIHDHVSITRAPSTKSEFESLRSNCVAVLLHRTELTTPPPLAYRLTVPPNGEGSRLEARREASESQRKYVTRLPRKPYKARNKVTIQKTPAEKEAVTAQRSDRREKILDALASAREMVTEEARKMQTQFGHHDKKYYQHQILQQAHLSSTQRKTNRWNAFLKHEFDKANDGEKVRDLDAGRILTYQLLLPPGAPRHSSSGPESRKIAERWATMTTEEKIEATKNLVKDLDDKKEMKALAVHSVPVNTFHDVHATMNTVYEEVQVTKPGSFGTCDTDFPRTSFADFMREPGLRSA